MKKLIVLLFAVIFLSGCYNKGEMTHSDLKLMIHGKKYMLTKVCPKDNEHPIWIMYPEDSLATIPTVINYDVNQGKHTTNETVIIVK